MNRFHRLAIMGLMCWAGYGLYQYSKAAPAPEIEDTLRYGEIRDAMIFHSIGVNAWNLHIPAPMLRGKKQIVLKMSVNGEVPKSKVIGTLRPLRNTSQSVEATIVIAFDNMRFQDVRQITVALGSKEFYSRHSFANPLEKFDGFNRSSELSDLSKGIDLATMSLLDSDKSVRFSLWVE